MRKTTTLVMLAVMASLCHAQDVPKVVAEALGKADTAILSIVNVPKGSRNFDNTLGRLDKLSTELDRETSLTIFMQNVSPDAKTRDEARVAEEAVTNWGIEVGKREDLYKAVKEYADSNPKLEGEQLRFLEFTMRDYRRSGMTLTSEKRKRLADIERELSKLGIEFETNIAEDQTKLPVSLADLKGVSADVISALPRFGDVLLMGFDGPTYGAVMDYCDVEATRQKAQWLYRRRGGQKNVAVLEKMLKLRDESAHLLGYKSTVDFETDVRMAKNAATVKKFYDDLRPIVRKKAILDFAEFTDAKRKFTKNPKAVFKPWDYAYYKNLLMRQKYAVDGRKVSEYFPMQSVVNGLFGITSKLYGISYKDVTSQAGSLGLPVWHEDVKLYQVTDEATHKVIGHFYTDLYPRDNKYSHAACWGLKARRVNEDGTVDLPLAALVCNFTKPTPEKPSLLPHDEVETFFHEFGHGLHNLFSQTRYGRFAGAAVSRDFVEAPSQMMENWVWAPEVLKTFAKHYKTGEVLPDKLLKGMKAAQTLGSGIETEGQFFLGNMDFEYHTAPGGIVDTSKKAMDVYEARTLYKRVPNTMPQASFGHLVGYQGAYYGYMWSLVYAQDMFQRFEELGLTNPKAGAYYRTKILSLGGSMNEMDMLRGYLGREPKLEAFLRHLGLSK